MPKINGSRIRGSGMDYYESVFLRFQAFLVAYCESFRAKKSRHVNLPIQKNITGHKLWQGCPGTSPIYYAVQ